MKPSMLKFAMLLLLPTQAAFALEASATKDIDADPAVVWATVGDFCGIANWHPAIEKCEPSTVDEALIRDLTLKDGGKIREQQESRDDDQFNYSYKIVEGPLPVSDYESTISVTPKEGGSTIEWKGTFEAKGAPDDDVVKLITGIYEAGVDGIASATAQ